MMVGAGDRASDPKMVAGSDDGAGDLKMVAGAGDLKMVAGADVDGAGDDPKMVAGADDGAGDPCWRGLVPTCYDANPVSEPFPFFAAVSKAISPIHGSSLLPPPPAKEAEGVDIEERMSKAAKGVRRQVSQPKRLHRFPQQLRGMGGPDGRYIVPSVVAIGPYHHGRPHLQPMEEVKLAAAHSFCRKSGRSVDEIYQKIASVAGDARRCYTADATDASDAEFATMMFLDGCFLLECMSSDEQPLTGLNSSCFPTIVKDFLLLENQIPLVVLEALEEYFFPSWWPAAMSNTEFSPVGVLVNFWMETVNRVYFLDTKEKKTPCWLTWTVWLKLKGSLQILLKICRRIPGEKTDDAEEGSMNHEESMPSHLLGILRVSMIHGMPSDKRKGKRTPNSLLRLSSSAVYLAQIGVKLTASTSEWFADINVRKKCFSGELSLSPMFLNDIVACILVNLTALEAAEATGATPDTDSDGFVVSSYLSVLAMLMDREEDVQELRGRGVLCSHLSNKQTLDFFKGFSQHLRLGYNYFAVVHEINKYIRTRPVRTTVHRFVYNNYKTIVAVLSIASVIVGIFKALYSLKKP